MVLYELVISYRFLSDRVDECGMPLSNIKLGLGVAIEATPVRLLVAAPASAPLF